MQELPTSANADDAKVARALAAVEAAKQGAEPAVIECLNSIADMIKSYGDPDVVFDRVLDSLRREALRALAAVNGLSLYESSQSSVDDGTVDAVTVFWPAFAIVPRGQAPSVSLAQLRKAIAERELEQHLADSFQASVAAGHTEDIETWHDRTSRAWKAR